MDREVTRIKDLKKEELEEKVLELRKRDQDMKLQQHYI